MSEDHISEDHVNEFNDLLSNEVEALLEKLNPLFDSIQIIATKHENEKTGTTMFKYGHGNYYARYGAVKCWLNSEDNLVDE